MIARLDCVRSSENHYTLNLNKSFLAVSLNIFKVALIKLQFMNIIKTPFVSLVLLHGKIF
jgi:hypothetical protein